ncbi:MAG: hypothetical protein JW940_19895 [Polyangiaceae bacterium]|nr:hypothetical protein [Polyangiaceae bacterium]
MTKTPGSEKGWLCAACLAASVGFALLGCRTSSESGDDSTGADSEAGTGEGSGAAGASGSGGAVTGGTATGGAVTGGTATGGAVTGGTATGGAATGGTATGGTATGGVDTTTGGTSSSGAATGGVSSGGTAEAGAPGTGGVAVACSTPLADRVKVTTVAVSPSVSLGQSRWGGGEWGSTGLPVILSTSPNGLAKVAWTDGTDVHVTPLDESDQRAGDDATVAGTQVRGLVAHDDGSALLVVRDDAMVFVRLSEAGAEQATLSLVGGNAHTSDGDRWIDDWPHNGRLAWSGTQYAAYFGQTGNFGAQGNHQGDHYSFISPEGTLMSGGWDWGCSHSLDERLAHNAATWAPICTSDTYPGAGIWFNNRREVSNEPSITNMGEGTKLGGLVPAPDGFWLDFASTEVVFVHISNDGSPSGRVTLPNSSAAYAHLAAYGDGLLAGWGPDTSLTIAELDTNGSVTEGPVAITAQAGGLDDWATYPNGDVGWAYAWGDLSSLQIIRVMRCE